jgi:hypothetical protein
VRISGGVKDFDVTVPSSGAKGSVHIADAEKEGDNDGEPKGTVYYDCSDHTPGHSDRGIDNFLSYTSVLV